MKNNTTGINTGANNMENNQERVCVGLGKIVKGQMMFTGKLQGHMVGFKRPMAVNGANTSDSEMTITTRQVEAYEVPRDIRKHAMAGRVQSLVQKLEKEVEIPSFMQNRKKAPVVGRPSNVIHVNFKGGDIEVKEESDPVVEAFDAVLNTITKKVESTRLFKYFFGKEEDRY